MKALYSFVPGLRPAYSILEQNCDAAPFEWEATGSLKS